MKRVVRLVSALSAGASLAWGIARALRKGSKRDAAPPWPDPQPAPPAAPVPPPVAATPAPAKAPADVAPPAAVDAEAADETPASEQEDILIKGVVIYDAAALLAFVNDSDSDTLREAGVKGKALSVLEAHRPFADVEALGSTSGVGRRTLQALCAAAGS